MAVENGSSRKATTEIEHRCRSRVAKESLGVSVGRRIVVRQPLESTGWQKFATGAETLAFLRISIRSSAPLCKRDLHFLASFHNADSKSENLIRIKPAPPEKFHSPAAKVDTRAIRNQLTGRAGASRSLPTSGNSTSNDIRELAA